MAIEEKSTAAEDRIGELEGLKALSRQGGGPERIEAQHKRGKLTARERLDILLDEARSRRWTRWPPTARPSSG